MQENVKEVMACQIEAGSMLFKANLDLLEKLTAMNIHAATFEMDASIDVANQISAAFQEKNPKAVLESITKFISERTQRGVSHTRSVYEVLAAVREAAETKMEESSVKMERELTSIAEKVTESAPAQISQTANQMLAVAKKAGEAAKVVSKTAKVASKKAAEIIEKNVVAATSTGKNPKK